MQSIEAFFATQSDAFDKGDIDTVANALAVPTSVYFTNEVMFIKDKPHLLNVLHLYHHKLKLAGVVQTRCAVQTPDPIKNGGLRVTVTWSHLTADGHPLQQYDATCMCQANQGSWLVALVEVGASVHEIANVNSAS